MGHSVRILALAALTASGCYVEGDPYRPEEPNVADAADDAPTDGGGTNAGLPSVQAATVPLRCWYTCRAGSGGIGASYSERDPCLGNRADAERTFIQIARDSCARLIPNLASLSCESGCVPVEVEDPIATIPECGREHFTYRNGCTY